MADFTAAINFQPIGAPRAPGMLVDYGAAYGVRRGGLSYGWNNDNTANAVHTDLLAISKTHRNDTHINMQTGGNRTWEIAVPHAGNYLVSLVSGDPSTPNERIGISVEGEIGIAAMTKPNKRFLEGILTVSVTDGKLTISNLPGYNENKINYLSIVAVDGVTGPSKVSGINWVSGATMLVPRVEPETAVVDGKMYVFSGYGDIAGTHGNGWQPSKSYDRYDPKTNKWSRLGNMPIATTHGAVAVVGKDIWIAGGYTARPRTTNYQDFGTTNVLIYHTLTNTWSRGPSLPVKRASSGMALVNNKLYYISGEPEDHVSNSKEVWVLDLSKQSLGWRARAPIPDGRTHFGTAVVNGKIYILGGQHGIDKKATFLKSNYMYDPVTNKWTRIADLPSNQSHNSPNTLVIGSKIYIFGGEFSYNNDTSRVLEYDPATNRFTTLTPLPAVRASGAAGYVNGKIVFGGGKQAGTFHDDTWIGVFR